MVICSSHYDSTTTKLHKHWLPINQNLFLSSKTKTVNSLLYFVLLVSCYKPTQTLHSTCTNLLRIVHPKTVTGNCEFRCAAFVKQFAGGYYLGQFAQRKLKTFYTDKPMPQTFYFECDCHHALATPVTHSCLGIEYSCFKGSYMYMINKYLTTTDVASGQRCQQSPSHPPPSTGQKTKEKSRAERLYCTALSSMYSRLGRPESWKLWCHQLATLSAPQIHRFTSTIVHFINLYNNNNLCNLFSNVVLIIKTYDV